MIAVLKTLGFILACLVALALILVVLFILITLVWGFIKKFEEEARHDRD